MSTLGYLLVIIVIAFAGSALCVLCACILAGRIDAAIEKRGDDA